MMVSKHIKTEIERVFGREIRYPLDCEALAIDISQRCNVSISASTLKRFFGFVTGTEPRAYTLDVLAKYIGFKYWEDYLESLSVKTDSSEFVKIEELNIASLEKGDKYEFRYEPSRIVVFEYKGDNVCCVVDSVNSKLHVGDVFTITTIAVDYPLLISSVLRNGVNQGSLAVGKVSGITSIKKIS